MNPIWLNAVRASGGAVLDPDAAAIIAAMTVPPNGARQTLINDTVLSLKAAGVWSLLDALWVMAAHDEQAGRLNWKAPASFTLAANGGITFTADRGWQGDGSSGYMDTGWIPATHGVNYQQNSASAGGYIRLSGGGVLGATNGFGATALIVLAGGGNRTNSLFTAGTGLEPLDDSAGFYAGRRSASNEQQLLKNGNEVASNTATSSLRPSFVLYLLAVNNGGSLLAPSPNQISLAFTAAAMTEAQQLALYNTFQDGYLAEVGAAV